jgi:hypothetical protein
MGGGQHHVVRKYIFAYPYSGHTQEQLRYYQSCFDISNFNTFIFSPTAELCGLC